MDASKAMGLDIRTPAHRPRSNRPAPTDALVLGIFGKDNGVPAGFLRVEGGVVPDLGDERRGSGSGSRGLELVSRTGLIND